MKGVTGYNYIPGFGRNPNTTKKPEPFVNQNTNSHELINPDKLNDDKASSVPSSTVQPVEPIIIKPRMLSTNMNVKTNKYDYTFNKITIDGEKIKINDTPVCNVKIIDASPPDMVSNNNDT